MVWYFVAKEVAFMKVTFFHKFLKSVLVCAGASVRAKKYFFLNF